MSMAIVVAVAGAGDIVTGGLRHILGQAPDLEILDEFPHFGVHADVVLYDVVGMQHDNGVQLSKLVAERQGAILLVGRDLRPDLAARAMTLGAVGCISIEAPTSLVLSTIRAAATGRLDPDEHEPVPLGDEAGLSVREVQILGDIVDGLANTEIAEKRGLSINTVKSYIRTTYRKIGVVNRPQAVSWGLRHGFDPGDENTQS
jgi:DNA-binding NarL/FixJ family response regulator